MSLPDTGSSTQRWDGSDWRDAGGSGLSGLSPPACSRGSGDGGSRTSGYYVCHINKEDSGIHKESQFHLVSPKAQWNKTEDDHGWDCAA